MLPSSTTFCRESKPAFGAYRAAVNDVLALDGVAADLAATGLVFCLDLAR